jgi:hypothetical protein
LNLFPVTTLFVVLILFITGCSTPRGGTLLGAGIGATAGGLLGNAIGTQNGDTNDGTWIGAASGMVLGGLVGYLGSKDSSKNPVSSSPDTNASELKVPSLSSPEVRRIWVPSKIENNKYIEGHYEYIIERQSVWIE